MYPYKCLLRHFLYSKDFHGQNGNVNITSPRSHTLIQQHCRGPTTTTTLRDSIQGARFKQTLLQHEKQQLVESDRVWVRQRLILAMCAMFGLCVGAILMYAGAPDASIFKLSAREVHDRQESNGELVFAAGVRWLLLLGLLLVCDGFCY
ncbi:unnamed protein product [Peronospora destructor]|uniref:Uncharacterized protein n=1 Tax=Peronospora destructor TaxID=86335 RepID=A0AAV0V5I1_9STRA|nr:unnamed protein product [Peronospora destructor]